MAPCTWSACPELLSLPPGPDLGSGQTQGEGVGAPDARVRLASHGGGGNRTRVRGRTGVSVYKHRPHLKFARRPVCDRPTAGLALLKCRAAGEWLSVGAEPAC